MNDQHKTSGRRGGWRPGRQTAHMFNPWGDTLDDFDGLYDNDASALYSHSWRASSTRETSDS